MGVNLRDLFPAHEVPQGWYHGKRIAVDGHNVAFRYLTSFRSRDGDVLRNPEGRVIAHLVGYLNLVRHLRERGAEPIIVWDGDIHPRKRATVAGRIATRQEAERKADAARAALDSAKAQGDAAGVRAAQAEVERHLRATTYLDGSMIRDATRLLEAVGVAVVRADHDGERFAAALCHAGHADAVATEDFDALVAGAPLVLRKAGGPDSFLLRLSDLQAHGLDQAALRHVAILCGTDWHPGVKGFGAKTAVKALASTPGGLVELMRQAEAGVPGRYQDLIRKGQAAALVAGAAEASRRSQADGLEDSDPWVVPAEPMTVRLFEELDGFIAATPTPLAPVKPRPDIAGAVAIGAELGLSRDRIVACFC